MVNINSTISDIGRVLAGLILHLMGQLVSFSCRPNYDLLSLLNIDYVNDLCIKYELVIAAFCC